MIIGTFGDLIFEASSVRVFSLAGIKRTSGKRTAKFTPVRGKEITEYLGAELRSVTATITLNANLGVKPRESLERIMQLTEGDEVYPLIIDGKPLSDNLFMLTAVQDVGLGRLDVAAVHKDALHDILNMFHIGTIAALYLQHGGHLMRQSCRGLFIAGLIGCLKGLVDRIGDFVFMEGNHSAVPLPDLLYRCHRNIPFRIFPM